MSSTSTATNTRSTSAAPPTGGQIVPAGSANVSVHGKALTFGEELASRKTQFQAALPPQVPLDRFLRVVLTAVQRNADLARADRASLITSAMMAAQDGLLPDGKDGAFVIYKSKVKEGGREFWVDKVQWMVMIGGLRKKVRNSGEIRSWVANVVYQKDHFEFELGDDPFIKHRPYTDGDPGPVRLAYSIATFKSGEKSHEVMTKAQIDKVRAASKSKDSGPWVGWYDEMCRKTVARRHSKVLPMSTDLDDLIRRDDDLYDFKGARDQAVIANGGRPQSLTSRLDVLAQASGRENAPLVDREPAGIAAAKTTPHDPDTGEIEADGADDSSEASTAPRDDADGQGFSPSETLMHDLRGRIMRGERVPTMLNALTAEQRTLLTEDDVKQLREDGKRFSAKEHQGSTA